jgi:hypothetical protein
MNANSLPTLTGSEKQISWATDIRAALVLKLEELSAAQPNGRMALTLELIALATDAGWWIEHRDFGWSGQLKALTKRFPDEYATIAANM